MKVLSYAAAALLALGSVQAQPQEKPKQPRSSQSEQTKKTGGQKKPRRRVVTNLAGFDLLEPSKLEKQTMVVGATRGLPHPVALAPRLGKLFGTTPEFAWSYAGESREFVFVVRDDAQEEVFRAQVTGNIFRYPEDAPAFRPEKTYFWTVEVSSPILGSSASDPSAFLIVSEGQKEEIEKALARATSPDPFEAGLARARVLTDYRLWYDVLAAYGYLIARYPDRAELYEQRGTIYAQLKVTGKLAEQDFNRAEELEK